MKINPLNRRKNLFPHFFHVIKYSVEKNGNFLTPFFHELVLVSPCVFMPRDVYAVYSLFFLFVKTCFFFLLLLFTGVIFHVFSMVLLVEYFIIFYCAAFDFLWCHHIDSIGMGGEVLRKDSMRLIHDWDAWKVI